MIPYRKTVGFAVCQQNVFFMAHYYIFISAKFARPMLIVFYYSDHRYVHTKI